MSKKNKPPRAEEQNKLPERDEPVDRNEPVVRNEPLVRKSYYGFSKKYPGKTKSGAHLIGDSLKMKRRETIKKLLFFLLLLLLFAAAYVAASTALFISEGV